MTRKYPIYKRKKSKKFKKSRKKLKNKTHKKRGGQPVPRATLLKAWNKKIKQKTKRARAQERDTFKKQVIGSMMAVMVFGADAAPLFSNNIINNTQSKKVQESQALTVTTPTTQSFSPIAQQLWIIACTGNTCRSPALKIAGAELGFDVTTCGTGVRTPGSPVTPALNLEITSPIGRHVVAKHQSQQCNVCSDMLDNSQDKIFAVVAESNAEQLKTLHASCKNSESPLNVVVLGDIPGLEDACGPLKDDPWDASKEAICPDRECTEEEQLAEKEAYRELPLKALICMKEVEKHVNERGDILGDPIDI